MILYLGELNYRLHTFCVLGVDNQLLSKGPKDHGVPILESKPFPIQIDVDVEGKRGWQTRSFHSSSGFYLQITRQGV